MAIQITTDIELGWRVRDTITGFEGIATGFGKFLNGCERIGVTPEKLKDGKVLDTEYFDVQQLVVVDKKPKGVPRMPKTLPGGPRPAIPRAKDPR
jgi:hypothetical protein